jgi:hypothetical protein
LIGALLALALLTDPDGLSGYRRCRRDFRVWCSLPILAKLPEGVRRVLPPIPAALILAIFAVYLFASGTFHFYRSTIWFNAEVYADYVMQIPIADRITENMVSGLNTLNPEWVRHLSPFIPLNAYRSVSLEDEALYFSWIFSNFLFRSSILVCALGLVLNRRFAAGVFLYFSPQRFWFVRMTACIR